MLTKKSKPSVFVQMRPRVHLGMLIVGLILLVAGARWLTDAAVDIATVLGISELVIGLTIVAMGTSLPEVATSVLAALRGERDIAVGNAISSNLFNLMGVLSVSSMVAADGITAPESAIQFDLPVMIGVAVACLPIFFDGHLIARWEGGLFFAYYCIYTAYLVLSATHPAFARTFGISVFIFGIPPDRHHPCGWCRSGGDNPPQYGRDQHEMRWLWMVIIPVHRRLRVRVRSR
jgi:cation:H+ antiporter